MKDFGHGSVGTKEESFTTLLPLKTTDYPMPQLAELAKKMQGEVDTLKDGADPEENLWVPAGYTYFGQFIDHDLTFDNTSSLNPTDSGGKDRLPTNLRTPRFDLDSLYGDGPDAQPFMYDEDGASLLLKDSFENQCQTSYDQAHQDLLRSPNGRAIIGDKRNDENSIVCQIHLALVRYHNAVVKELHKNDPKLTGTKLFDEARNQVRWTYQKLVIEDFLPRIVKAEVLADLQGKTPQARQSLYALYTEDKRSNLPREFVVAAYRFGHSGVRFGYRLNRETSLSIFPVSKDPKPADDSLLGFDPLPESHVIDDWGRFFPSTLDLAADLGQSPEFKKDECGNLVKDADGNDIAIANPAVRLQFAYKLDPTLVDPLTALPPSVLPTSRTPGGAVQEVANAIAPDKLPDPKDRPSLALLNLLRGNKYKVQGGQAIAKVLQEKGRLVESLDPKYLVTRGPGKKEKHFKFDPIDSALQTDTPLWFYVLAEAQKSVVDAMATVSDKDGEFEEKELLKADGAKTQLGWVGGRIVAEVFYGLLDSDDESYVKAAPPSWQPMLGGDKKAIFLNLIKFL
jgi:Animal haem peroxidase